MYDQNIDTINVKNFYNFSKQLPITPIRIVSYFLKSKFLDPKNENELKIRGWESRAPYIYQLLNRVGADIILLQGMNLDQCKDIISFLEPLGYNAQFRAAHTGKESREIIDNEWTGAFVGIAYSINKFTLLDKGGFWLKEDPDVPPPLIIDNSENRRPIEESGTDKCFGDTHSYRYVYHETLLNIESNIPITIGTSHFPIGGFNSRLKSSKLAMERLCGIAGKNPLIFGGALMLFEDKDGNIAYETLTKYASDYRNSKDHYGHQTSFIGYPNDPFKVDINSDGIVSPRNLDLILHRGLQSIRSFIMSGEFNSLEKKLVEPLISPIKDSDKREFASDRCLIGVDLQLHSSTKKEAPQRTLNSENSFNFSKNLSPRIIRAINWNIRTSFLDPKDEKEYSIRGWQSRKHYVTEMLTHLAPDLILLQEMSPSQAVDMKNFLNGIGYEVIFRAAHTGHDLYEIIDGEWTGALTGIAYFRNRFFINCHGGFWLKDDPHTPPPLIVDNAENRRPIEEGGTDKCFGDTHSYRHCQWATFLDVQSQQLITTAVSDFPISGKNSRLKSASLCNSMLREISGENCLIFGGEICTFEDKGMDGFETYKKITEDATDWRNTLYGHYGHQATFVGYHTDKYKVEIDECGIVSPRNIDIIVHRGFTQGIRSFSLSGEFNLSEKKLNKPLISVINNITDRLFSSDHFLIGVDLEL
ncbi:putative endonuclease/exonuclease/phosphatase [Megavirus lba]|uniref:Putative endonuclease/exonuclease/phosphatase n=1 Tax=Megavirus lba TaxID=1235314 RepID=L7Y659_9VIRU|nr:putative endonuclease/exonuclease/phosphatase [Megavirus lba]